MSAPPPFINRELSWIEFNARVLAEAENPAVPLLERLKFLAIAGSNFDEFFMVRVATIKRQVLTGQRSTCPTGTSPRSQLTAIHRRSAEVTARLYRTLTEEVLPGIAREGLSRLLPRDWNDDQRVHARSIFRERILPVLTPLRIVPGDPLTTVRNLSLHAAFLLEPQDASEPQWPVGDEPAGAAQPQSVAQPSDAAQPQSVAHPLVALVPVPASLERLVYLPEPDGKRVSFSGVEQLILEEGSQIFPGYTVVDATLFRVTRDADLGVDEERDEDFLEAMEQVLETRERSRPVRLSVSDRSERLTAILSEIFGMESQEVYVCPNPLELSPFMRIALTDGFDHLRNKPWHPLPSPRIDPDYPVWDSLRRHDVLLHLPYESFDPVVRLVREAAEDEHTRAIKITLYRVSADSPIVRALESAARKGKQVTVLVELKARFDEQTNIDLAQRLERAGAIVVHGIARLKVHSKALLVIRQGARGIERYAFLGTGNFNDKTATLYGDMGLFTAQEQITTELGLFFNAVTGYSVIPRLRSLVLAPGSLRPRLVELIRREASRAASQGSGQIIAKMNSLADAELIGELYQASQAGVKILLNVRGICMLVPGLKGVSENIRVISIVDRYLEHARIFHFENGGASETYLSSADWMPRNLDRRVELMFPLEDATIKRQVREILGAWFSDTEKAHELGPDQKWHRVKPRKKATPESAQSELYQRTRERAAVEEPENREMFNVRRRDTAGGTG